MDKVKLHCAHCGSDEIKVKVIESAADYVDVMPDMLLVRRALEVAIFGRFSICFAGHPEGYGPNWARIAGEFGLTAHFITPCLCGNLLNPRRACSCSIARINRYHEKPLTRKARSSDLYMEVTDPREETTTAESFKEALSRIEKAVLKALAFNPEAINLLRAARRELSLTPLRVEKTKRVANAIACLSQCESIGPEHVAEAVQYQPKSLF